MKTDPEGREKKARPPLRAKILVGGLRGSSGKTAVTLGLIGGWKKRGIKVQAFKKGPDYIDAAWHTVASGRPCYCLDVYLMAGEKVVRQFRRKAREAEAAVIEGNRGLFDGVDVKGSYSTAELAKLLNVPVLLVVEATKNTRTTAALVLGCQRLDPEVRIVGVVLNRVSGARHEGIARAAIEAECGIPVVGAVPTFSHLRAPERHLGLVTPQETPAPEEYVEELADALAPCLDVERILSLGRSVPETPEEEEEGRAGEKRPVSAAVRIGVIRDSAFPFYYAENLEALTEAGAELMWIRSLDNRELPEIDVLYLGGGFPETHAEALGDCRVFRDSIRRAVGEGLPVYAECGGAVYLGRRLHYHDRTYEMAGVLPLDFEFCSRPQGHGYTEWVVERENPFYLPGLRIRGHEFHYTRLVKEEAEVETVAGVVRGRGFDGRREGVRVRNVVGFYGHVHALGCEEWARGMVAAAARYAKERRKERFR